MAVVRDEPAYVRPATLGPLRTAVPVYHPPKPTVPPGAGAGAGGGAAAPPKKPPDYLALLKASPAYRAWVASRTNRLAGLATQRAQAIRQLILQFGGVPKGFQDSLGDLRPDDLAAANANQFSTEHEISRAYDEGRTAMQRSLAARGMLQSGDLGYGEDQALLERGRQENTATNNFMAAINSAVGDWTSGVGAIDAEEPGLIAGLMPQIREMYPYDPTPPPPPPGTPPPPKVPLRTAAPTIRTALTRPAQRTAILRRRSRPRPGGRQP